MFDNWWFRSKYLKDAELNLFFAYAVGAGSAALAIASPFVLNDANKKYYKSDSADLNESFQVFSAYIGCLVGYDLLDTLCQHIILEVSNKVDQNVIKEWAEKICYMSVAQRKPFENGIDIHRQLSNARNNFFTQIQSLYVQGTIRIAQIIGVFIASFFIVEDNRTLSGVFGAYLVLNVLVGALYRCLSSAQLNRIAQDWYNAQQEQQDINQHHLLLTTYNIQEAEITKLKRLEDIILNLQREGQWVEGYYKSAISLLGRLAQLCILAFAAQAVLDDDQDFNTTDLVTVLLFFQLLLAPMQQLNSSLTSLMSSEPTLKRIKEVINSYTYERITILPSGSQVPTGVDRKTIIIRKVNNDVIAYWSATNGILNKQLTVANLGDLSRRLFPTPAINNSVDAALIRAVVERFECAYIQLGNQAHMVFNPLIQPPVHDPVVEFNNVSFAYPGKPSVFNNLSFVIHPNTVNVIVGQSSVGKSTIFRLLTQLFDQFTGNISVNGQNIKHISAVELQQYVVLIPQITEFFDRRALRENIKIANSQATPQQVDDSLNAIELGGLIPQLDNQYPNNCKLEELSGGAQKRMGAARCLVRQQAPEIYIFDEPTTGLDAKIAFELMEKLKELAHDHTVLLITHYLKFAEDADQILFMYKDAVGATQTITGTHASIFSAQNQAPGAAAYRELLEFQSDAKYQNFWH